MTAIEDDLTWQMGNHADCLPTRGDASTVTWSCGSVTSRSREWRPGDGHRAHLAAVLAPIVAKHVAAGQERAWDEGQACAWEFGPEATNPIDNPYAATYTTTKEPT